MLPRLLHLPAAFKDHVAGVTVPTVQPRLGAHGVVVVVDGIWGPSTESAVCSFQTQQGIGVDGIVGSDTWARLAAGTQPNPVYLVCR